MFIMMLVHFFFGGGGYYVVPLLLSGCVATRTLFFLWGIFFIFIIIIIYIFFENHGLGLGTALFRLGTRVGPAMQKNFNLSWKFFQIFRENLGFETCFKFQFGDSLAWMTIQEPSKSQTGDEPGTNRPG
jgi:hypothetical protein